MPLFKSKEAFPRQTAAGGGCAGGCAPGRAGPAPRGRAAISRRRPLTRPAGRDMAAALLLFLAVLLEPAAAVWPQPQAQRSPPGGGRCPLAPRRFRFGSAAGSAVGPGCAVLEAAFQRYWALLFAAARPTGEAEGGRGGR